MIFPGRGLIEEEVWSSGLVYINREGWRNPLVRIRLSKCTLQSRSEFRMGKFKLKLKLEWNVERWQVRGAEKCCSRRDFEAEDLLYSMIEIDEKILEVLSRRQLPRVILYDALKPVVKLKRCVMEPEIVEETECIEKPESLPLDENNNTQLEQEVLEQPEIVTAVTTRTCLICDQEFSQKAFRQHLLIEHAGITCSFCDEVFTSTADKIRHLLQEHRTLRKIECNLCPEKFHNQLGMEKHLKYHKPRRLFPSNRACKLCSFRTHDQYYFNRHREAHKRSSTEVQVLQ